VESYISESMDWTHVTYNIVSHVLLLTAYCAVCNKEFSRTFSPVGNLQEATQEFAREAREDGWVSCIRDLEYIEVCPECYEKRNSGK